MRRGACGDVRPRALVLAFLLLAAPLAAGCFGEPPQGAPPFDGDLALAVLLEQVTRADGSPRYRIPGTEGREEAADLIADRLRDAGITAERRSFTGTVQGAETPMENVVGTRPATGQGCSVVYLAAHYDSRPWADSDPDPGRRTEPVLGANDGASGVGVLLAVANALQRERLPFAVTFLFFDGEDLGTQDHPEEWIQGSKHHAALLDAAARECAVGLLLLDMVGDARLTLYREGASARGIHRPLQDLVWRTGHDLGHRAFVDQIHGDILDDHRPFQEAGVPAVDVIHLDREGATPFPDTWHTVRDVPENVSKESLRQVGETVLAVLAEIADGGLR